MSDPTATPKSDRRALIEAVIASTVGTTIEWYDFFLYGLVAARIFDRLFFPELDPFAGQLAAYGTFTMGFVARPLGGVFFGWMGDRIGRKSTLVATLLLMGVSTVLIGLLPTYDQIGVAAPALLVLLRFCQGLGVGGEWGGAVLLALEYGHKGRRGFYASWPQAGVPLGLLGAGGVLAFVRAVLSEEQFLAWGWRVPFLLSGVLIAVGLIIRQRITETPLFNELVRTNKVAASPVWETLRHHWGAVVLAGGARVVENASFYLFTVHALAYATKDLARDPAEKMSLESAVMWGTNIGAAISFFMIPFYGVLSDWWSRRGMYVLGCLLMIAIAWPFYAVMQTRDPTGIMVMIIIALVFGHAMLYSVQASLIPELFGTRLRYTGASIGYQLAAPFAGGVAPLIAASLVKWSGSTWPLAVYVTLMALLSLGCVLLLAETSRKDISADVSEGIQLPPRG
jgi:MHS family shikimate/dehydroshikimate transporter-like MFS transporter